MTDETPTSPDLSLDRTRIEAPPKRVDKLPAIYLVGFLILGVALIWLWQHPVAPRTAALEAARINDLSQQVDTLAARVKQLEARPAAAPAPDLGPLETRLAALERRPAPAPAPAPIASAPLDLGPMQQRIDAASRQASETTAALSRRVDQIETRLGAAETNGKQVAASIGAATDQAQRAVRLQAAGAALDAGQSLGPIPGAGPALARFASTAPPTPASLRLSFAAAAQAAHAASQPGGNGDEPFLTRAWTRAQQAVTVRQGDKVLVGDPSAGIIEHARMLLDAGDIAGALNTLDGLPPSAKAAMAGWMAQAKALVDARAALADMARS
jgi:hypothetical protein